MGIGDWGLGIGDWGLGIGPNPQSPIPNPQSPFPPILIAIFIIHLYKINFLNFQKMISKQSFKLILFNKFKLPYLPLFLL
jgi:hypothetical protein